MRAALGIDVGLSAVRAAVLSDDGRLLGTGRRALGARTPAPRRWEHDPRAWVGSTFQAGGEAVRDAGVSVDAVAVGALGPAPVLVDARLEPLTPALLFSLDTRAEPQRARFGGDVTHDHALPKLRWWSEHEPRLTGQAAWALDAAGFLVGALTGVPTMDSITRADYLVPGEEIPVALPDPLDPLAIAGGLTERAAGELGLAPGTPVAAGTYDTYVDVSAAGVRAPGDACVLLGSTLVLCRAVDEPVRCDGLELSRYPGDGLLLGGWTAAGGSVLDWFSAELGSERPDDVALLEPGAGGLIALPYLAGERTPVRDPFARGLVLGLTLRTRRGELQRALVDGLALAARDHLERLASAGLGPDSWNAAGGGTGNRAWLHATADALGAPLEVRAWSGEAIGPAFLALRAIGCDPPRPVEEIVVPDPGRHERFERLYAVYHRLHPLLADVMRELGALDREG
jgi:xylulokinase